MRNQGLKQVEWWVLKYQQISKKSSNCSSCLTSVDICWFYSMLEVTFSPLLTCPLSGERFILANKAARNQSGANGNLEGALWQCVSRTAPSVEEEDISPWTPGWREGQRQRGLGELPAEHNHGPLEKGFPRALNSAPKLERTADKMKNQQKAWVKWKPCTDLKWLWKGQTESEFKYQGVSDNNIF